MSEHLQGPVSREVWPWTRGREAHASDSGRWRPLLTHAAIPWMAGALIWFVFERRVFAIVLIGIGAVFALAAMLAPSIFRHLDAALRRLGTGFAAVLTWVVLVPLFYLCFVPGGFFLRARGIDPLARKRAPHAASFWTPRAPIRDRSRYEKQY